MWAPTRSPGSICWTWSTTTSGLRWMGACRPGSPWRCADPRHVAVGFWTKRGYLTEGRQRLERALECHAQAPGRAARGHLSARASGELQGDAEVAVPRALAAARSRGSLVEVTLPSARSRKPSAASSRSRGNWRSPRRRGAAASTPFRSSRSGSHGVLAPPRPRVRRPGAGGSCSRSRWPFS